MKYAIIKSIYSLNVETNVDDYHFFDTKEEAAVYVMNNIIEWRCEKCGLDENDECDCEENKQ